MIDPFDWNGNGKSDDYDRFMDFVVFQEIFENNRKDEQKNDAPDFSSHKN